NVAGYARSADTGRPANRWERAKRPATDRCPHKTETAGGPPRPPPPMPRIPPGRSAPNPSRITTIRRWSQEAPDVHRRKNRDPHRVHEIPVERHRFESDMRAAELQSQSEQHNARQHVQPVDAGQRE